MFAHVPVFSHALFVVSYVAGFNIIVIPELLELCAATGSWNARVAVVCDGTIVVAGRCVGGSF